MHNSNLIIFFAELVGTFGLLVAATGSIVYDASLGMTLGPIFVATIHFVGLTIVVYAFGKYSMAHFNPAVTIGYFISGHIKAKTMPVYFGAQAIGAFLGTFFVKYVIGDFANLGLNFPNYSYSVSLFYGVEIIATIMLMGVILTVVHIKGLNKLSGFPIGAIIGVDPCGPRTLSRDFKTQIRSLSPAIVTGIPEDLWLYWSAPFIGSAIAGLIYHKKFSHFKNQE